MSATVDQKISEVLRAELEAQGYTVIKTKNYLAAQRRQRGAEMQRQAAEEHAERQKEWAIRLWEDNRMLRERVTEVYGIARANGVTHEQLAGSDTLPITKTDRPMTRGKY